MHRAPVDWEQVSRAAAHRLRWFLLGVLILAAALATVAILA
jgi:hypothetical protein